MKLKQSELQNIFKRLTKVYSAYNGKNQPIEQWLDDLHKNIASNKKLIEGTTGENDMLVLKKMLSELLMRSSSGETGAKIKIALDKHLITKEDLTNIKYRNVLIDSGYRFKDSGVEMMGNVVKYFRDTLNWNWEYYFDKANNEYKNNFKKDDLLKIRYVGYKVRDLALSGFNENYIANDIHVIRVASRLGLPIELDKKLLRLLNENRGISKADYLKLHRVFLEISKLTNYKYTLSDIDRIFWHFGRTVCRKEPLCQKCPVNNYCEVWNSPQTDKEPKKKKKILYVDMDGVLVDIHREIREKGLKIKEEINDYIDNTEGLFQRLKPMKGAIEAFEWLDKHFEVYILTTAPWKNVSASSDKRWWVEEYLPETAQRKLIITHNKGLNKGDYLIDDRIAKGVEDFEGEHIHFGQRDYSDWKAVLKYLAFKEDISNYTGNYFEKGINIEFRTTKLQEEIMLKEIKPLSGKGETIQYSFNSSIGEYNVKWGDTEFNFNEKTIESILNNYFILKGKWYPLGASMHPIFKGGLGEYISNLNIGLTPRHSSAIAAIFVDKGLLVSIGKKPILLKKREV